MTDYVGMTGFWVAVIAAVASAVVSVLNAWRQRANTDALMKKANETQGAVNTAAQQVTKGSAARDVQTQAKVDAVAATANSINRVVNGHRDDMVTEIAALKAEIQRLLRERGEGK